MKCLLDIAELPVEVHGSGPWKLVYEIFFRNKARRYSRDVSVEQNKFVLVVDKLDVAGIYTVDLVGSPSLTIRSN